VFQPSPFSGDRIRKAILPCLAPWHKKFQTIQGMMESGTLTLLNPLVEILSNNGGFETGSAKGDCYSNYRVTILTLSHHHKQKTKTISE